MPFFNGDVVKMKGAGADSEIGRICSVEPGGYWVIFPKSGCLYLPLNSLVSASGKAPACPDDCPPPR